MAINGLQKCSREAVALPRNHRRSRSPAVRLGRPFLIGIGTLRRHPWRRSMLRNRGTRSSILERTAAPTWS